MGSYLIRRLLLMIPTLVGISFLVFMLIAVPGGGVSAVLRADAAGSVQGAVSNDLIGAYLDDRYGLDQPVIVQYGRWLERISPIKFGRRDQVAPGGETVRLPRAPKVPPMWRWFVGELPRAEAGGAAKSEERPIERYRVATSRHSEARSRSVAATVELRRALATYAASIGRSDWVDVRGLPRVEALEREQPETGRATWAALKAAGDAAVGAYGVELKAHRDFERAIDSHPFPMAGIPILPGLLSVALPDLGIAYSTGRSVSGLIASALPVTLLLNLIAVPLIYVVAVPAGVLAGARRGSAMDRVLGAGFLGLWSIPVVLGAVLAAGFLANPDYFNWFPASGLHDDNADRMRFLPSWDEPGGPRRGYLLDALWHLALPVLCLVYGGFAFLSKTTRAAVLESLGAEHVRTARAKGVPERDVVMHHVVRNSLLPLITVFVGVFPALLSGSVVVERVFSIPGMGSLVMQAISYRDRELLMATTMMIAVVNLVALLLADVLYAWADPRVGYHSRSG